MAATAMVQVRVTPEIKEQAAAVLAEIGLTLSDAVRLTLTRTAQDKALPPGLLTSGGMGGQPVALDAGREVKR